jgi:hypothetical protein
MKENYFSAKILSVLFLLTLFFHLPAEAQDNQTSVTYNNEKLYHLLLAQHGFGWGQNLQPPVVSIEACAAVENTDPNSPGPPRCIGRGGLGGNGFWRHETWILVHFKRLTPGEHRLYKFYQGRTREGQVKNFKKEEQLFKNNLTGWWLWFRSPIMVGEHCAPCWVTLNLDGPTNLVGGIEYSGSFE